MSLSSPYFLADPWREVTYLDVEEFPTVVQVAHDFPLAEMSRLFDATFTALFPALGTQGLRPVGPAFSLHRRMPTDTTDFEIGVPVDRPLGDSLTTEAGTTLTPSVLPGGRVAIVSHVGPYDGLGEAWGGFMGAIAAAGHEPAFPLWEIYVTEPSPEVDPSTLRTDLVTRLRS